MRRNLSGRGIRSSSPGFGNTTLIRNTIQRLPLIMNYDEQLNGSSANNHNQSYNDNSNASGLQIGVCSEQGRRPYQEDEYAIRLYLSPKSHQNDNSNMYKNISVNTETHFFGLFDGHAGGRCSKYLSSTLPDILSEDSNFFSNLSIALKKSYHTTNDNFLKVAEKMKLHDGSTGICSIIRDNKLTIGNVGDCRAIIVTTSGKTIAMSNDQKPTMIEEQKRIASLGGVVINCMGVSRVNGVLAVSRAFGNRTLKQVIKPDAEITSKDLSREDEYLVMASDGLWDVLRNKDVGDTCHSFRNNGGSNLVLNTLAEQLVHLAISKGSMDNVTCIVVKLTGYINKFPNSMNVNRGPSPATVDNQYQTANEQQTSNTLNQTIIQSANDFNNLTTNSVLKNRQTIVNNDDMNIDSNHISNTSMSDILNFDNRGSSAFTSSNKKSYYPSTSVNENLISNTNSRVQTAAYVSNPPQSNRRPNSVGPGLRRSVNPPTTMNHTMPVIQPFNRNAITPSPTTEWNQNSGRLLNSPISLFVDSNRISNHGANSIRRPTPRRNITS
eukprot:gene18584-24310_t